MNHIFDSLLAIFFQRFFFENTRVHEAKQKKGKKFFFVFLQKKVNERRLLKKKGKKEIGCMCAKDCPFLLEILIRFFV